MFSKTAEEKIKLAIIAETDNACDKWGDRYNSLHEGYAVLKEEVDEVRDDQIKIKNDLYTMWERVKLNDGLTTKALAERIKSNAENLAMEAIQVAAVCNKILNGL